MYQNSWGTCEQLGNSRPRTSHKDIMWMHDIYIGSNFSTFIEWKWKASLAPADCRNPEVVEGCGAAIALLVRDPMAALVFKSLRFSIGMWFRLGFVQVLHYLWLCFCAVIECGGRGCCVCCRWCCFLLLCSLLFVLVVVVMVAGVAALCCSHYNLWQKFNMAIKHGAF